MDSSETARDDFNAAVETLASFTSSNTRPLSANLGVAVAVLLHRASPGRFQVPVTGEPVTTSELQIKVCDPTWEKDDLFLPPGADGPIYKPFTRSFKGRSPRVNNWRNSFDIQGGIGCSAPFEPAFFQSAAFVEEHRFDCFFRESRTGICKAVETGAHCFVPNKNGSPVPSWSETSANPRPKLLRRSRLEDGTVVYSSVEPTVTSLSDLLGEPNTRVPAKSFAAALFAGSQYWSKWGNDYSAGRLQRELALDDELFFTLFDRNDPSITAARSVSEVPLSPTAPASAPPPPAPPLRRIAAGLNRPVDFREQDVAVTIQYAGTVADPEKRRRLLEGATQGHRRILNSLAGFLRDRGFRVDEQPGGYDLHATDGVARHLIFEAKTWTSSNLASQVRSGWAQLEEYAYRNRRLVGDSPELVLVLSHRPPTNFWAWEWFRNRKAPRVIWTTPNGVFTFDWDLEWLDALKVDEEPRVT